MKRVICDLCKNIISEEKFAGGPLSSGEFTGERSCFITVDNGGFGSVRFDVCKQCAIRLASALRRGVLEPDDLPELPETSELPEEENHG